MSGAMSGCHHVSMMASMYPNVMGWPLVTCDVVVTGDLATSAHNNRRALPPITTCGAVVCGPTKHASL